MNPVDKIAKDLEAKAGTVVKKLDVLARSIDKAGLPAVGGPLFVDVVEDQVVVDSPFVIPYGKKLNKALLVKASNDFKGSAVVKAEANDRQQFRGLHIPYLEIRGNPLEDHVAFYGNGLTYPDLNIKAFDCGGGGVYIHGWNVRLDCHIMECGMKNPFKVMAPGLCIHNDFANINSDRVSHPDEWHKLATNIVQVKGHIERSPVLLAVEYGVNDVWYQGLLHGIPEGDRAKYGVPWLPHVKAEGASGALKIDAKLNWTDRNKQSNQPALVVSDLDATMAGGKQRPLVLEANITCNDWDPLPAKDQVKTNYVDNRSTRAGRWVGVGGQVEELV